MPTVKVTNLAKKHKPGHNWSEDAKLAAVSQYLVLGNMKLVSSMTGIGHQLLRNWKMEPWWGEMEAQIRASQTLQMDGKLSAIVDKSLDAVMDRLENGEFVYNQKTGQVIRKQVNMKDAAKVSVDLLAKRELLRGNATERKEVTPLSVQDQLKQLAMEFAKWQSPPTKQLETIDVVSTEIIQEEVGSFDEPALYQEEMNQNAIYEEREEGLQEGTQLGTHESPEQGGGPGSEECSTFYNGEGWQGP